MKDKMYLDLPTSVSSVKWSEKNKIYLSFLKMISLKTGRKIGDKNHSEFINDCVTYCLEMGKGPAANIVTEEQLVGATKKVRIALISRQMAQLRDQMLVVAGDRKVMQLTNKEREIVAERIQEELFAEIVQQT